MSPKQITTSLVIILALILGIVFLSSQVKKTAKNSPDIPSKQNNPTAKNIFSLPNFYLDANGKAQPIQTEIVKSTDSKYGYMNTTNTFKTYFPKKLDASNSVKFETDDASINFSIVSQLTIKKIDNNNKETIVAQKSVGELNQTVGQVDIKNKNIFSYPKIYQNADKFIDIIYTIYNYKLSEEIVLNKFQDFPELTQNLVLNNAYAKVENQTINFYHQVTNKLIWFISPPQMYEQNNKSKISLGLYYDLKCKDSTLAIEKCSNLLLTKKFTTDGQRWLSDPSRQYPVVIDPVINEADALTGSGWSWATSDTVNFSTAVDTSVYQESTGSIRMNAIGNSNCWSYGGSCDSGCNNNGYSSPTVYTTCNTTSQCGGTTWTYGGNPSLCFTSCQPNAANWGIQQDCFDNTPPDGQNWMCVGNGQYYCSTASGTSYFDYPNCTLGTFCFNTPTTSCVGTTQTQYSVGGSTTKYSLSGTPCSAAPSGSCYKANGGTSSYYNSNGSCGGGANCGSASYYGSAPNSCTGATAPGNSLNDTMTLTYSTPIDLSTAGSITFYVRSTRTGSFIQFGFGESVINEQTSAVAIASANTWEQKTWNLSAIAAGSRNGVTTFTIKNTNSNVGSTIWFDLLESVAGSPNSPIGCLIRETQNDSSLTPRWTDNSSDENGFQIEKNTNGGGFTFLVNVAAGVTNYVDSSVSSNNTYSYRVRSFTNGTGTTVFSTDYATCPTLDLHTGSFKFEGLKMEGVKLN